MSEGKRFPLEQATEIAKELVERLKPHCEIIEIAGSIRRKRKDVGDIEIAYVSKTKQQSSGLFDTETVSIADNVIDHLLNIGIISRRLAATGRISSWGADNKHAVHIESGIPVDFFAERDIRDFPRTIAIRTGPKSFNVHLMTMAPRYGHHAHAYGEALHKIPMGERVFAATEREFIELCGVEYAEPEFRL